MSSPPPPPPPLMVREPPFDRSAGALEALCEGLGTVLAKTAAKGREAAVSQQTSETLDASLTRLDEAFAMGETVAQDVETITERLLPAIEANCLKLERIYGHIDELAAHMEEIKLSVALTESRLKTMREGVSRRDPKSLRNVMRSFNVFANSTVAVPAMPDFVPVELYSPERTKEIWDKLDQSER